ncbi:response regulator transcription factor [Staphylococcus warneri]|uniref:response regulator transcription factor n=1 Tax=Staphylococcus warneri TaxID=1292 RepID=UPI001F5A9EFA|nr:response regulator transcription factor [Staphylococcus warneri]MCI2775477.1 response regulator transcription factor [Staphylococcus warneri]
MITMIIAEDQHMLRKAMVQLIELNDDLKVIADVGNGNAALELIKTYEPDIAILDIEMPGMTGIEILAESKALKLQTKIIVVTTFKRPGYFEKAVANDVDAYVLKERSIDELVNTIQKVVKGKKEYSDSLMTSLITYTNPLTHKEQVVLREIGNGLSSKDIADKLYLSNGTIRNYTSSIIDKLEAENRFDAWKIATNNGCI